MQNFNFDIEIANAIRSTIKDIGRVNILIAGSTGVGKSTLINAIFQGNFATTGQGRPVTRGTREIKKDGIPLSIFDTRGLEIADYEKTLEELRSIVAQKARDTNPNNHIHVAWVCISEDSRRVQPAEEKLVEELAEYMPVIGVITKIRTDNSDNGFRAEVQRILPQVRNVVRVRAMQEVWNTNQGEIICPPEHLDKLVESTMEVLPESLRRAFAAAQKVDIEQKRKYSLNIVNASATSAAAAAAIPIPFYDAIVIVPIQMAMLAGISATFGLSFNESFFSSILGGIVTGGTMSQQSIISGIIKFIPVVGSATGGVISGSTAFLLTLAFGRAYVDTLNILFSRNNSKLPTQEEIINTFKQNYKPITQKLTNNESY